MQPLHSFTLLTALLFAGCAANDESDSQPGTPDAPSTTDGPIATDPSCAGERIHLAGAFELDSASAAVVEVSTRIVGVGGFTANAAGSYSMVARDVLTDDFAALGVHDVALKNVKLLTGAASAGCQSPGECTGFIARSGRFEVTGLSPYRATFALGDLYSYDGSTTAPGAAIAGEATGCVTSAN
jgi:hypothetical protein